MARRNIYLTDDLDKRVRAAIEAGGLDASDVCAEALGRALNGQRAEAGQLGCGQSGRLDVIEHQLHQLVTAVSFVFLLVGVGVLAVSVRTLVTG
jgi:hypothetical protein